jgi:mitogen-activated protein kinase 15
MFLQQLNHPNIIIFQKIIKSQNQNDIYLLFEYMDVDLYFLIRENMLEERHKKYIVYQIAKALYYVHSADLVHRDIKPSNILVN